jgi:hypothetical protein
VSDNIEKRFETDIYYYYYYYMFQTSLGPSSGETTVYDTGILLFCIADCLVCIPDGQLYRTQVSSVTYSTVVPPDDGP